MASLACPDELPSRRNRRKVRWLIGRDACREIVALPSRGRSRQPAQLAQRLLDARRPGDPIARIQPLPPLEEGREVMQLDRLDLLAQGGEGPATRTLRDAPRAPLRFDHLAAKLPLDQRPGASPFPQSGFDPRVIPAVPVDELPDRDR